MEGWPRFESELLRACIFHCVLLSPPGSHEQEQETWHSAESYNVIQCDSALSAICSNLLAAFRRVYTDWIMKLDSEIEEFKRNYITSWCCG